MTAISDKTLRARVKLFGNILGKILEQQAGSEVLEAVETLRKGYISLRKRENSTKRRKLTKFIEGLDNEALARTLGKPSTGKSERANVGQARRSCGQQGKRCVKELQPLWELFRLPPKVSLGCRTISSPPKGCRALVGPIIACAAHSPSL